MQQEIKYFVRLAQCTILNKIFVLDLYLMSICKHVVRGIRGPRVCKVSLGEDCCLLGCSTV
jgi:hypothetical protein